MVQQPKLTGLSTQDQYINASFIDVRRIFIINYYACTILYYTCMFACASLILFSVPRVEDEHTAFNKKNHAGPVFQ